MLEEMKLMYTCYTVYSIKELNVIEVKLRMKIKLRRAFTILNEKRAKWKKNISDGNDIHFNKGYVYITGFV